MSDQSGKQEGIFVPARFIPTPTTVSAKAQQFLSNKPPVGISKFPALDDKEGWRAEAEEANRNLIAFSSRQAQRYPAESTLHHLGSASLYEITPRELAAADQNRAILFIHGGGFNMGGGKAALYAALPLAATAKLRTYSLDYRMPPDHPFPAALDDSVAAYRWLLEKYRPEHIAIYGPSAGGNLAPACILKARDLGLPLPGACAVHSPASDLTESGDTYETNQHIDFVLQHRLPELMQLYANGHDLRDPLLSPAFADYTKGFPPTILTSGTRDLLLSSTVMLHRAMRRAGVSAELHVWEAMTHAPFFDAPEEEEWLQEQARFLRTHLKAG